MAECLFTACTYPPTLSSFVGACALHQMALGREMALCWADGCGQKQDSQSDRWCTHHVQSRPQDVAAALAWLQSLGYGREGE